MKKPIIGALAILFTLGLGAAGRQEPVAYEGSFEGTTFRADSLVLSMKAGLPYLALKGLEREDVTYESLITVLFTGEGEDEEILRVLDGEGKELAPSEEELSRLAVLADDFFADEENHGEENDLSDAQKSVGKALCLETLYTSLTMAEGDSVLESLENGKAGTGLTIPVPLSDRVSRIMAVASSGSDYLIISPVIAEAPYPWEETLGTDKAMNMARLLYKTETDRGDTAHGGSAAFLTFAGIDSAATLETENQDELTALGKLHRFLVSSFIAESGRETMGEEQILFPLFAGDPLVYQALYGGLQSDYTRLYMEFLLEEEQPLNRTVLTERGAPGTDLSLSALTETEREAFVSNAKRYLSWGVEYTLPYSRYGASLGNTGKDVYAALDKGTGSVPLWIGETDEEDRAANYYGGDLKTAPTWWESGGDSDTGATTHIFESEEGFPEQDVLAYLAETEGTETLTLESVEYWTAQNLLWSDKLKSLKVNGTATTALNDAAFGGGAVAFEGNTLTIEAEFFDEVTIRDLTLHGDLAALFARLNDNEACKISITANVSPEKPIAELLDQFRYCQSGENSDFDRLGQTYSAYTDSGESYYYGHYDNDMTGTIFTIGISVPEGGTAEELSIGLDEIMLFDGDALGYITEREGNHYRELLSAPDQGASEYLRPLFFGGSSAQVSPVRVITRNNRELVAALVGDKFYQNGDRASYPAKESDPPGKNGRFLVPLRIDTGGIKTIVVRESSPSTARLSLSREEDLYRYLEGEEPAGLFAETPFPGGIGLWGTTGNPIPYTVLGVDSPRTFLNKMSAQAAEDSTDRANYRDYASDKPRPGHMADNLQGYDETDYRPSTSAGSDSVGLVLNSLAMIDSLSLMTVRDSNPIELLDSYNKSLSGNSLDLLSNDHRLTAGDLENLSVVIPHAADIQQGDILVRYTQDGAIETMAIVLEDYKAKGTRILTTSRERRHAYIGEWQSANSESSLDSEWRNYVARRLLKTEQTQTTDTTNTWDLNRDLPDRLNMTVDWTQTEHWVPNTGIALKLGTIGFGIEKEGEEWTPWDDESEFALTVLPLIDPYAGDKPDGESGNIYENSREGGLELCYKEGDENSEPVTIVTYHWDDTEEAYAPVLTDLEGYFYLGISSEEASEPYELVWMTGDREIRNNFYVRQTGTPFPGDDFLFDFALTDYPGCRVAPEDDDINFVAVYDHKMLWRANLYIDEAEPGRGDDWNNIKSHKWNSADNEWNRSYDFSKFTNNKFDLLSLTKYDSGTGGGQVIQIYPFTHTWQGSGDTEITNRVSYEYNGTDSPFAYLYKMDNQKTLLNHYYTTGNALQSVDPNGSAYEGTTAPENLHKKYVFGNTYPYNTAISSDVVEQDVYKIPDMDMDSVTLADGKTYYPYVPSLEDGMKGDFVSSADYYAPYDLATGAGYGAGTDCLGFITRAASYSGNPYNWAVNSLVQPLWGDSRNINNGWPLPSDGEGYLITSKSKQNADLSFPNLEKIIPGDIFYYGSVDNPNHILMVTEVDYSNSTSRSLDAAKIRFIESVYFSEKINNQYYRIGSVKNYRHLDSDSGFNISSQDWFSLRLSK